MKNEGVVILTLTLSRAKGKGKDLLFRAPLAERSWGFLFVAERRSRTATDDVPEQFLWFRIAAWIAGFLS
jgi:hypothetical protein